MTTETSPRRRSWNWHSPWLLAALGMLPWLVAAGVLFVTRPATTAPLGTGWLTVDGISFRITAANLASDWQNELPFEAGNGMLAVEIEFASETPDYLWDLVGWDSYVTDGSGARTEVAVVAMQAGFTSNDLMTHSTLVFELPRDSTGLVLHFPDGQTVSLDPLLGRRSGP